MKHKMRHTMKTLALTTALAVCLTGPALAAKSPRAGAADPRVKTLTYHESDVYRITGHYGFSTLIEFDRGEVVESIAIGDKEAWQIVRPGRGNLLYIKPLLQNANTNMNVLTNRRVYSFELTARQSQSHKSNQLAFRIRFQYPEHTDTDLANLHRMDQNTVYDSTLTHSFVPPEQWNFDYSYAGSKRLRPQRAFDDGTFTYMQFSKTDVTPAVFAVDEDGHESLVNFTMRGKYLVVESLARQFTLRDGNTATCIFNDNFPEVAPDPLALTINGIEDVSEHENAQDGSNVRQAMALND